jgi:uncharacterized protein (UPF0264 family)
MHLLVSVGDADEATAALDGGADIVDAKDPRTGALGAVALETFCGIHTRVAGRRPLSAAGGDAADECAIERVAFAFASAGAAFVKVGFLGVADVSRAASLAAAARRGVVAGGLGASALVVVAYEDADTATSVSSSALVDLAAACGANGVLLDTADKNGPGLRAMVDPRALTAWIAQAQASGLFVAVAGRLTADDLPFVREAGADIAGVRGAACEGGRLGRVSAARVRRLRALAGDVADASGLTAVRAGRAGWFRGRGA